MTFTAKPSNTNLSNVLYSFLQDSKLADVTFKVSLNAPLNLNSNQEDDNDNDITIISSLDEDDNNNNNIDQNTFDTREFHVNRVFLGYISPVFKAMLYGNTQESKPNATVYKKI